MAALYPPEFEPGNEVAADGRCITLTETRLTRAAEINSFKTFPSTKSSKSVTSMPEGTYSSEFTQ